MVDCSCGFLPVLGDKGLKLLGFCALEHADHHQVIPGMLSPLHRQGCVGGREA